MQNDETLRQEFATAFNWYEPKGQYDYSDKRKPMTPSWMQIFVEVGKILAHRDFREFEGNISELEVRIDNLERKEVN